MSAMHLPQLPPVLHTARLMPIATWQCIKHSHTSLPLSYMVRQVLYSNRIATAQQERPYNGTCAPCVCEHGNAAHSKRLLMKSTSVCQMVV